MINFYCIHCGIQVTADLECAGVDSSCPSCGREIVVPNHTEPPQTENKHADSPPPLPPSIPPRSHPPIPRPVPPIPRPVPPIASTVLTSKWKWGLLILGCAALLKVFSDIPYVGKEHTKGRKGSGNINYSAENSSQNTQSPIMIYGIYVESFKEGESYWPEGMDEFKWIIDRYFDFRADGSINVLEMPRKSGSQSRQDDRYFRRGDSSGIFDPNYVFYWEVDGSYHIFGDSVIMNTPIMRRNGKERAGGYQLLIDSQGNLISDNSESKGTMLQRIR